MTSKRTKGAPTSLNIAVLRRETANGTREIPNRCDAGSASHLVRCFRAGLLEQTEAGSLRLTVAGRAALEVAS